MHIKYLKLLCAVLVGIYPFQSISAKELSPRVTHQFFVDLALTRTLALFKDAKTGAEFAKRAAPYLPPRDRAYVTKTLGSLKKIPKFERLNAGFAYTADGVRYKFVIEDLYSGKFTVNDKVPWTYSSENPLELQIQSLNRSLSSHSAMNRKLMDLLIPKAEAELSTLAALAVGAVFAVVIPSIYNLIVLPGAQLLICPFTSPKWYFTRGLCKPYFDDLAETDRGKLEPQASPPNQAQVQIIPQPPKCPTPQDPTFVHVFDVQGPGGKATIRRTITYTLEGETLKPKEMLDQMMDPPTDDPGTTYILDDKFALLKVKTKTLYLTRDPNEKDLMDAEKFQKFEKFDTAIKAAQTSTSMCNAPAQAQLEAAAAKPDSPALQVLMNEPGTVPSPGARPAPGTR